MAVKLPEACEKGLTAMLGLKVPAETVDEFRALLVSVIETHESLLKERDDGKVRIAELEMLLTITLNDRNIEVAKSLRLTVECNAAKTRIADLEERCDNAIERAEQDDARVAKFELRVAELERELARALSCSVCGKACLQHNSVRRCKDCNRELNECLALAGNRSLDKDLDASLKRIFEKYGKDLPAFFRDAYAEYQKGKSS